MVNWILKLSKILWDYHHMYHAIEPSDLIMVLWSHDARVAERWVELFKQGYAERILFSGWIGRLTNHDPRFSDTTEAEYFAQIARNAWISEAKILIENRSSNTGENILFSFEVIRNFDIKSIILVQKPYMERRTFATFSKQWPGEAVNFRVTSPEIPFEKYHNTDISIEQVINIMVGDLQRIIEYPKRGFQIYQEVPNEVLDAYDRLVKLWYDKSLIKFSK